jgi:hypothetical protein
MNGVMKRDKQPWIRWRSQVCLGATEYCSSGRYKVQLLHKILISLILRRNNHPTNALAWFACWIIILVTGQNVGGADNDSAHALRL